MSAPLAAAKVAWRAAFDKLDIAEIGPSADGNPEPCRRGNPSPLHRRAAVLRRSDAKMIAASRGARILRIESRNDGAPAA
ncbi:hypothetical protein RLEG3_34065 [Rhizobium leguminosarum bv. trifolii WSM1689]|nr:hypothetical protein RLEG3_34065 [Rhizobium leguminosarum bv. trifolii WSM1689]